MFNATERRRSFTSATCEGEGDSAFSLWASVTPFVPVSAMLWLSPVGIVV